MTNPIFKNEAEMQAWLEDELQICWGLSELIANKEKLEKFSPKKLEEKKIHSSFINCLEALHVNTVFSANQNISLSGNEILKPDLVLYAPEVAGIVIVELKNSANAARQAGTEISAYAAELKNHLLFLSDGDVFNVIISPEWKTLLKHHVLHEIFWKNRNILCLKPIQKGDSNIQLEILPIQELLNTKLTYQIPEEYLCGYQLCLYDHELKKNNSDERMEYFNNRINQMKAALSVMAAEGERQASHGFAFLWQDNDLVSSGISLCPYNITMMNIAPFESVERFFQTITDISELSDMQRKWVNLIKEHAPSGQGHTFNCIANLGEKFLSSFCKPCSEGYAGWNAHKSIMFDKGRADLVAFAGWGIFQSMFNEKLLTEYTNGNLDTPIDCPYLGLETIETIIDTNYEYINLVWSILDEESLNDDELWEDDNSNI